MKVGDRVILTRDIWEDYQDGWPAHQIASKGDDVEIRKLGGVAFQIHVAHPHREPDAMFGVREEEIKLFEEPEA